ncbi:hypothetical protein BDA99DRAFT_604246 [Phascolomyces articulosus]|uniref:F-box domain-containing protein n=1 Tax=Phascolomyces articulosus TaxID=60185 RepID=A0AAD5PEG7_9FUNG|nr:hypothetical protein BDA99DRAFT_604246 [Phascolomyces articulosus]
MTIDANSDLSPLSMDTFELYTHNQATKTVNNFKTSAYQQHSISIPETNEENDGKKIDFIKLLPYELIYDIFHYYNVQFIDFVTCTHVNAIWRAILMNYIWPSLSVTTFFSTYPLNRLTPKEQDHIRFGLLGSGSNNNNNQSGQLDSVVFSIQAHTHERTQAVIDMGNCGLQVVDLYGSPFTAAKVFLSNANTLNELSISLSSCYSYIDLSVLFNVLATSATTSTLSKMRLTAAPFFNDNGRSYELRLEEKMKSGITSLPTSLIDIKINGFPLENRLDLIKFFLKRCKHLQSLVVHPVIPRISISIENELEHIKKISPPSLHTLIY